MSARAKHPPGGGGHAAVIGTRVNEASRALAANEDHRYRSTGCVGPDLSSHLIRPYLERIERLSTHDPGTRLTLRRTYDMLDPPSALFHPRILARVLRQTAKRRAPSERAAVK